MYYNAIMAKYIYEENSIIKLKHEYKLKNLLVSKVY